ncbi:hypothetical protein FRB99_000876 [Tulasnella sp. 403]|nr:hypothetical protein FRB99_000876 [Tulasnella sp. 403]
MKQAKASNSINAQYGKYGIITEADIYTREQEFHTWLIEERQQNPETLAKPALKKLFLTYMEDYNTATLPHEKYYALEAYEKRMQALRGGEFVPQGDETYDISRDLAAHKAGTTRKVDKEGESFLSRDQLLELQQVQRERIHVGKLKALGLEVKSNLGVRMDGNQFD